jgi:conserved hypothetical protein
MSATTLSIASVLNSLIEICKDGQEGYQDAAERVTNVDYKSLFTELASQRQLFIGELRRLVMAQGESVEDSGSIAGAVHRGWLDLKAAVTSGDEHALLEECERGEDFAVARYRVALEHDELPENIQRMIAQQYSGVQAAHDRVKELRDRTVK